MRPTLNLKQYLEMDTIDFLELDLNDYDIKPDLYEYLEKQDEIMRGNLDAKQ